MILLTGLYSFLACLGKDRELSLGCWHQGGVGVTL